MSLSNTDVTVRTVDAGQIKERPIAFDRMKSPTNKKGTHEATKILAGVGIALGALLVYGLIVAGVND